MFFEERVAELMRKMLRKKLFVVISTPAVPPDKLKPFLMAHLEYMIGLEQRGLVFASGPLSDGAGAPSGQGLTILRAANAAEARALAEGDPFFVNKLRTFELKEWTIMEGSLGLRVNLSDQSIEVT
ncbi:MAG TPA: YciI family protein [Xanthobacteraceae bacterium]|nr:YciI family protein [Xanthobacteraceae bacterium]